MRIAWYISGHGYGHIVRSCVVLNALPPEIEVWVVGDANSDYLARQLRRPYQHRVTALDIGVIQPDGLTVDLRGTWTALSRLDERRDQQADAEAEWLGSQRIDRVFVDIPPLACVAARRAGIPAWVVSNFTWDDIYREYARFHPDFGVAAEKATADYALADGLFELPFHTEMPAFRVRRSFGLVARRSRLGREEARRRLGWEGRRWVLISFGGLGIGKIAPARWKTPEGWGVVATEEAPGQDVWPLDAARMQAFGLEYPDLVAAVDAVMTKPGYGIVSECLAHRTPMIFVDRGPFAEYPRLVEGIEKHLVSYHIQRDRLLRGDLIPALEHVAQATAPSAAMLNILTEDEIRQSLDPALSG